MNEFDPSTDPKDPNRMYLLFAGSERAPRGGLADLVRTFSSREGAVAAFREIRLAGSSDACWAQLAVIEDAKGVRPLCWFGIVATPNRNLTFRHVRIDDPARRRWRRRSATHTSSPGSQMTRLTTPP